MRVARGELWAGRALLLALMAFTILPFISIFTTALHPSGTVPSGLEWPADPQWGNFVEAFNVANMTALLASSTFIVLAVVPVSLVISTMAGFAIGLLREEASPPGANSPAGFKGKAVPLCPMCCSSKTTMSSTDVCRRGVRCPM